MWHKNIINNRKTKLDFMKIKICVLWRVVSQSKNNKKGEKSEKKAFRMWRNIFKYFIWLGTRI